MMNNQNGAIMNESNYNFGAIGNCRSAALVDERGEMIWLCLPDFDSMSVFAALLDKEKGGSWGIRTEGDWKIRQYYLYHTNILVTRFEHRTKDAEADVFELHDLMPRFRHTGHSEQYFTAPEVIRYLKHISGAPKFRIHYRPALAYGAYETCTEVDPSYIKSWSKEGSYESVYLYSDLPFEAIVGNEEVILTKDAFMLLSYHQKLLSQTLERNYLKMERTKVYWLDWVDNFLQFKQYHEEIIRSSLVLKLMTFQPTGAVLAAFTTSLPETIGEQRNWDYRYCWIRDASMTVSVFSDLFHRNTVRRYLKYILGLISTKDHKIQIVYGIRGEPSLPERNLDHLSGYLNSKPVRIGNDAYRQVQNDVYGVLLDVIFKSLKHLDYRYDGLEDLWTIVRTLVHTVERVWRDPDNGIWEFRGRKHHFVFSKAMCWTAVDRGIRIAERLEMSRYIDRWSLWRDEIREDIYKQGWNPEVGAFTQYYGAPHLDAANLLLEYYGFIEASDPRYVATVLKTKEQLCEKGLVYRYRNEDDFGKPSSSFTVCSFWLVYALHRIGLVDEAREIFDGVLAKRNALGLLSEDISFETGRLLGNFPQAYSHLALITCASLISGRTAVPMPR